MGNVNYPGRYINRPSLSRLRHHDGRTMAVDYPTHRDGLHRVEVSETAAFVTRFVQHIPDKNFRMASFYGFLANRVRG